ncbi:MAG TPA: NUDIX hydrolase [Patescibacteria group bacterium]|nr:NUDIX hydrolase [Patescibacteria group bacterium]
MSDCNINSLKKRTINTTTLFDVNEYTIQLKTGKTVVHHTAERRPTVSVLPVTKDGEVYLVSQYRYLLGKTSLEAMAGFVDEGESALHAAKRELSEETGIQADSWEELGTFELSASVFKGENHIFLARDLTLGDSHQEEDEDITVVKMPIEKAVQKVFTGEINVSSSVIGILLLERLKKEKKL